MRLWHVDLLPMLSTQRLLGQHRECCAMRGLGWGRKHSVVGYVWEYNYDRLYIYHVKVMNYMLRRGIKVSIDWYDICYRGKRIGFVKPQFLPNCHVDVNMDYIFKEHDKDYYDECVALLQMKGDVPYTGVNNGTST
jgi:uncharacterized protein (TIGR02328 family)